MSGLAKTKAKIRRSQNYDMDGVELKRLRDAVGMTQEQLAEKLNDWGWYRDKVHRLEDTEQFSLRPAEMQALLDVLDATSL